MNGPKPDVPTLKPTELFDKRRQRDNSRLKAYNKVLEQIYTRIKTNSRMGADPWIIYTVPPFILGLPRLDMEDCIVYLVYVLRQQGYEVRYTYPNLLYISWKHHEKDYILKTSPIMQAMTAATVSSKPKNELRGQSQARVRFAESVISQGGTAAQFQANNGRGRAPPKSVTEYQPPTSFLDALERPVAEPRKDALADFTMF
jgi:hypothetical protein